MSEVKNIFDLRPVLDHGYVKLIDSMGTDETIIEAARMSTGKGFEGWQPGEICSGCGLWRGDAGRLTCSVTRIPDGDTNHTWKTVPGDAKLLEYLYKNQHHTPFEMCELAIEVQAPIFVFREWHRHRTQSYNEFSARYAVMPNLHYIPALERMQTQSATNKQGSAEPVPLDRARRLLAMMHSAQQHVYGDYEEMIEQDNLAKEVARVNTPVSRYSKMRAKTDLRSWLGFLNLRLRPNAQYEIRCYAEVVSGIIKQLWPRTHALFLEYDLNGVRLSATEAYEWKQLQLGKFPEQK